MSPALYGSVLSANLSSRNFGMIVWFSFFICRREHTSEASRIENDSFSSMVMSAEMCNHSFSYVLMAYAQETAIITKRGRCADSTGLGNFFTLCRGNWLVVLTVSYIIPRCFLFWSPHRPGVWIHWGKRLVFLRYRTHNIQCSKRIHTHPNQPRPWNLKKFTGLAIMCILH
jgi:hypothetical protein